MPPAARLQTATCVRFHAVIPRRVLLVTSATQRVGHALKRAMQMAGRLGAELHVLHIARRVTVRRMQAWCEEELRPRGVTFERLHRSASPPIQAIKSLPREIAPDLIVLPAEDGGGGRSVTRLARATRIPVLAARSPGGTDAVLAAVDLREASSSVIGEAAGLARVIGSPALLLHNRPPGEDDALVQLDRLRSLASGLELDVETVVTRRPTAAEAIVRAAQARDADIVVVGTYAPAWLARLASPARSVAVSVVEHCRRSVLVIPLVPGATAAFAGLPSMHAAPAPA
jgi:nucleotide-binding universal stress UspA family protein